MNYLAVVVAALASFFVGMLWYSPLLFGKVWMKLMNINEKKMKGAKKKGMVGTLITAFVTSLVTAFVLNYFIQGFSLTTGLLSTLLVWLGFFATTSLGMVLWENKPVSLYLIKASHELVSLLAMALVLLLWS